MQVHHVNAMVTDLKQSTWSHHDACINLLGDLQSRTRCYKAEHRHWFGYQTLTLSCSPLAFGQNRLVV